MEREYVQRGQRADVQELSDVVALKPSDMDDIDDPAAPTAPVRPPAVIPDASPLGRTRRTFEDDGWVFVAPTEDVTAAVEQRQPPAGARAVQRVFETPSGQVLLGLDRLDVRLVEDLSSEQARQWLEANGLAVVRQLTFVPNLFHVKVPPGRDFRDIAKELSGRPEVVYAEPLYLEKLPTRFSPANDPYYDKQWQWNNTGEEPGATASADIRAEDAWDLSQGEGIIVAIIDHGFKVSHPDLTEAVDDDLSAAFRPTGVDAGPARFVRGRDEIPNLEHGTFCAGIALARAGNNHGGVGVAFEARFMAVATTDEADVVPETLARAIAYAVDPATEIDGYDGPGADVISCSLAPATLAPQLQDAIDKAVTEGREGLGTPIFWAVSNENEPIANDPVCSYHAIIAVGRSNMADRVGVCGHGPELDFLAPGDDVFSTKSEPLYGSASGTSFAAPAAAGVAALLLARKKDLTWEEVRQIMRDSCDRVGGVTYVANRHQDYGSGRVNAAATLLAVNP
jgi:thermitase